MNLALIVELVEMLKAAREHLEYCGYGDSWERECAYAAELPERLEQVIEKGQRAIDEAAT